MKMIFAFLLCVAMSVRSQDVGHLPGDLEIGGFFAIRENSQGKCAEVSPVSVQLYEAAKWTCKFVNEQNYLPGFTLGKKLFISSINHQKTFIKRPPSKINFDNIC